MDSWQRNSWPKSGGKKFVAKLKSSGKKNRVQTEVHKSSGKEIPKLNQKSSGSGMYKTSCPKVSRFAYAHNFLVQKSHRFACRYT